MNDLKAWRTTRLGAMKQDPRHEKLTRRQKQIVDHLVRKYESRDEGIIVAQKKLAERIGVSRRTIIYDLGAIVDAGVFTRERRGRKGMMGAGRTTNRYRLNVPEQATNKVQAEHSVLHLILHNGSSTDVEHIEALGHIEGRSGSNGWSESPLLAPPPVVVNGSNSVGRTDQVHSTTTSKRTNGARPADPRRAKAIARCSGEFLRCHGCEPPAGVFDRYPTEQLETQAREHYWQFCRT